MNIYDLEKVRKALGINTKAEAEKALEILSLDCPEWQKRELFEKEFGLNANSDELTYLLPDGDNKNALDFAVYLDNKVR